MVILTACSNAGPRQSSSGNFMKATVGSQAWAANPALIGPGVGNAAPGQYIITGPSSTSYIVVITLHNIDSAGSYPLGVGLSVPGGTAVISDATGGWSTPLSGSSGRIEITQLTEDRIAGTFTFSADASSGSATGTLEITDGEFDLPVNSTVQGPPATGGGGGTGSVVRATIDGADFSAANTTSIYSVSRQTMTIVANTLTRSLTFSLSGVDGPGTYPLTDQIPVTAIRLSGSTTDIAVCCWGSNYGGSGEIIITTLSDSRLVGSFTGTLLPAPIGEATGELMIDGTLDIAIRPTP